ncbi:hypothetical protein RCL1_006811 [Eukaryota sp. TZLM3-RCL]
MERIQPSVPAEIYDLPLVVPPSTFEPKKHSTTKPCIGGFSPRNSSYIQPSSAPGKFYSPVIQNPVNKSPINKGFGSSPRFAEIKSDSPGKFYSPLSPSPIKSKETLGHSPRFSPANTDVPGVGHYKYVSYSFHHSTSSPSRKSPKSPIGKNGKPLGLGGSSERFTCMYPRVVRSPTVDKKSK